MKAFKKHTQTRKRPGIAAHLLQTRRRRGLIQELMDDTTQGTIDIHSRPGP